MVDVSGGHSVVVEILSNRNDIWVDHQGKLVSRFVFSQAMPDDFPLRVYDAGLDCGAVERSFGSWPIDPIERLNGWEFSLSQAWSDPAGSESTPNFLMMLEERNAAQGASLVLTGRRVRLWVSNGKYPGLRYSGTSWLNYDDAAVTPAAWMTTPAGNEAVRLMFEGIIEQVAYNGGRIQVSCTSPFEDTQLGTPVSADGGSKRIRPVVWGDFQRTPWPVSLESIGPGLARCWLAENLQAADLLAIGDDDGRAWPVVSPWALDDSGRFLTFRETTETTTATYDHGTGQEWPTSGNETIALNPAEGEVGEFLIDQEAVAFHSPHMTGPVINGVQFPPLMSRGWGGTRVQPHSAGAKYFLAGAEVDGDSGFGYLLVDVKLSPINVSDISHTFHSRWPDHALCARVGGSPVDVFANSESPREIQFPIVVGAAPENNPERHAAYALRFEFPDVSALGDVIEDGSNGVRLVVVASGHTLVMPPAQSGNPSIVQQSPMFAQPDGVSYTDSPRQIFPAPLQSQGAMLMDYGKDYASYPLDVWKSFQPGIASLPLTRVIIAGRICKSDVLGGGGPLFLPDDPWVTISALRLEFRVRVRVTPETKLWVYGAGRQGVTCRASDILKGLYKDCWAKLVDATSGPLARMAIREAESARDVARAVALGGALSVASDSYCAPRLVPWRDLRTSSAPFVIFADNVPHTASGCPDISYGPPVRSSVYDRFVLRWGWDAARERYDHYIVVDPDYGCDVDGARGADLDLSAFDGLQEAEVLCETAKVWRGQQYDGRTPSGEANTYTLESKTILDLSGALYALREIVLLLATPRMTAAVNTYWKDTQALGLLETAQIEVSGIPVRVAEMTWAVVGISDDPRALERKLSLAQLPVQVASNVELDYLDEAEVSMLCYDGSDGQKNKYQLTPQFTDGRVYLTELTWWVSNPSKATISGSGVVSVRPGATGEFIAYCSYKGVVRSCAFTAYQTMPSAEARKNIKGGRGAGVVFETVIGEFNYKSSRLIASFHAAPTSVVHATLGSSSSAVQWESKESEGTYRVTPGNPAYVSGGTHYAWGFFPSFPSIPVASGIHINATYTTDRGLTIDGGAVDELSTTEGWVHVPYTGANTLQMRFTASMDKAVLMSQSTQARTHEQAASRWLCDMLYIPQLYIRYTDTATRQGLVRMPNLGTMGKARDMLGTVPANSDWFGV